jgi:hypothetical protein
MEKRTEASCLIRLFALLGAWVDPSVSCNRSDEVSPSSEDAGASAPPSQSSPSDSLSRQFFVSAFCQEPSTWSWPSLM